uniref:protein pxr-1-like n=1 Tax=Styela clava TaxID=7725 RepID=UPI00193A71D3|nr:protein pxr-1-like [Styela clava]
MRRPKVHDIETLRREAEEVKEIARTSIINMVEQRNSALDRLTANTAQLEEFAHGFATCAQEARLKQQARVTCCGIGSKWKVCWYICACQGKIKRRKRKQQKNGKAIPEAEELLEDDDYYRPANTESSRVKQENEIDAQVETNPFLSKSNTPTVSYSQDGNKEQSQQQSNTLKSKLLKLPKTLRGSLPSLVDDDPPPGRSLRSMANIDPRERKSSSVSALHEIVKKRGGKERLKRDILEEEARDELPPMSRPLSYLSNIDPRQRKSSSVSALNEIKKSRAEKRREEKEKKEKLQQREKREKDIDKFASQYTDEDTRKKVAELLELDLS